MHYAYLIDTSASMILWLVPYFLRSDLRKELWFGSLLGLPYGVTAALYARNYWNVETLFDLSERFGFGIEDFIFAFIAGGVTSVAYDFIAKKGLVRIYDFKLSNCSGIAVFTILNIGLALLYPRWSIYMMIIALLAAATWVGWRRRDLIPTIAYSALLFSIIYSVAYGIFSYSFPSFVQNAYLFDNITGTVVLGIPLEEMLFAIAGGAFWSINYKYILGYTTHPLHAVS